MKKFLIGLIFLLAMMGCSSKKVEVSQDVYEKVPEEVTTTENIESISNENKQLKEMLEQRPNVTMDELRATMNLSLRTISAMINEDYEFLESIVDSGVTVNKESNSFIFEGHEQNFISDIDYDLLEYRFHDAKTDGIIVGFAVYTVDYIFKFKHEGDTFKLISFLTN